VYKAWHIPARKEAGYHDCDLITEIMGNGFASRLFQRLVKEEQLFSHISCYHTGSLDPGLIVVEGKVVEGKSIEAANEAIEREMNLLLENGVTEQELAKAKNKIESMIEFEDMGLLNRANNLAFYELLGDAHQINHEWERYQKVTTQSLLKAAQKYLRHDNCNTLLYKKSTAQ
jgi:predicted Zn-dependent peptidase